jgi:hypothetical protein
MRKLVFASATVATPAVIADAASKARIAFFMVSPDFGIDFMRLGCA